MAAHIVTNMSLNNILHIILHRAARLAAATTLLLLAACSGDSSDGGAPEAGSRLAFRYAGAPMSVSRAELTYNRLATTLEDGAAVGCVISDSEGNFLTNSEWRVKGGYLVLDNATTEGVIEKDTKEPYVKLLKPDVNYRFGFYYPMYNTDKIAANSDNYPKDSSWNLLVGTPSGDEKSDFYWQKLPVYTINEQTDELKQNHSDIMWCGVSTFNNSPLTANTHATVPVELRKKCATIEVAFLSALDETVPEVNFVAGEHNGTTAEDSGNKYTYPVYHGKYLDLFTGRLADIDAYNYVYYPKSLTKEPFSPLKIQSAQDVEDASKRYDLYRLVIMPQRDGEFYFDLKFKTKKDNIEQSWTIHLPDNPYLRKMEENTYYRLEIKKADGTYTWDLVINDWNNDNEEWILPRPY